MRVGSGRVAVAVRTGFLLCVALSAAAHHSGAMFDDQKTLVLTGSVKSYQWTNPHCWIQLLIAGDTGPVEWSVEMGSPSLLFRGGWRPTTLHPGDTLVMTIRPMRDGTKGGLFLSATRSDGSPIVDPASLSGGG